MLKVHHIRDTAAFHPDKEENKFYQIKRYIQKEKLDIKICIKYKTKKNNTEQSRSFFSFFFQKIYIENYDSE